MTWTLAEVIQIIRDAVLALTAATGAAVAIIGLRAWKHQLRGRSEYELGRRLLRAAFDVRDNIAFIRTPFKSAGEIAAAFEEAGIEPEQGDYYRDRRIEQVVYDRRWKALSRSLSDLGLELIEAEVLWGSTVRDLEDELQQCVSKLFVAIREHLWQQSDP